MTAARNIPLIEDFGNARGRLTEYDAYDLDALSQIRKQAHVDIRSFQNADATVPVSALTISSSVADVLTDEGLDPLPLKEGENWTAGTVQAWSNRNYWNGLSLSIINGLAATTSVMTTPVDILTDMDTNLVINGSFEDDIPGWNSFTSDFAFDVIANPPEVYSIPGGDGVRALHQRYTSISGGVYWYWTDNSLHTGSGPELRPEAEAAIIPVVPGKRYTSKAVVDLTSISGDTTSPYISLDWWDSDGNYLSSGEGDKSGVPIGVYSRTASAVAPYNAASVSVGLCVFTNNGQEGGTLEAWWDNVSLIAEDNNFISMSVADYPGAIITAASSYLDLTSHPTGDFTAGPTVSLPFSSSTNAPPGGTADVELKWPRSDANALDLTAITGVRIRVTGTNTGAFRVHAIRLLSEDWVYPQVDQNTQTKAIVAPVTRDASVGTTPDFVQPILFRADEPSGVNDPEPINATVQVPFFTGTLSTAGNQFTIYFREKTDDYLTQLDLYGTPMSALNGNIQPDVGDALYAPRPQTDLDDYDQTELDGQSQYDLERTRDNLAASWLEISCKWKSGTTQVTILNSEGEGYGFTLGTALATNTNYLFSAQVEDDMARVQIYSLNAAGTIVAPLYDSYEIWDDTIIKRRKGRFGWHAALGTGDAAIHDIRPINVTFAEHKTFPFESLTPVSGAQLYTDATKDISLFSGFSTGPWNIDTTLLELDYDQSNSNDGSYKITSLGHALQGVQSNEIIIADWDNTEIRFDIYVPQASLTQDSQFRTFLSADGRLVELLMPRLTGDQWTSVNLRLPLESVLQAGRYRLLILQIDDKASTWWLDNVSVNQQAISWDARSHVGDPWSEYTMPWTPFYSHKNGATQSVQFHTQGNTAQLRGRAHTQTSRISKIEFVPRYAELGRLVFPSTAPAVVNPTASFTSVNVGGGTHRVNFTSTSTDSDGRIILHEWLFGDGQRGTGEITYHYYAQPGNYLVTLVAVDNSGGRSSVTTEVGVT